VPVAFSSDSLYSIAAIDLNRLLVVLFVDQSSAMLQAAWVMLRIAIKVSAVWNRQSDCRTSFAHSPMLVEGLGS
jgi:hypothetical protein